MILIPSGLSDAALEDCILAGARSMPHDGTLLCNESVQRYAAVPERRAAALAGLLQCASELQRRQLLKNALGRSVLDSPQIVRQYLAMHFQHHEVEAFVVAFLNAQHAVIAIEEMFCGTLTQTSVYPREVVRRALRHNAAAVVLAHNHPSGTPEPSRADEYLTQTIKAALALVDVRTLDHFVVCPHKSVSFAERGLL